MAKQKGKRAGREASVYVVTAEDVFDATGYVSKSALAGAGGGTGDGGGGLDAASRSALLEVARRREDSGAEVVEKASGQSEAAVTGSKNAVGRLWVEPRIGFNDLLLFYDWNTWHRRCVLVKATLATMLGWRLVEGDETVYEPGVTAAVPERPAARLLARPNGDPMESLEVLVFRWVVDRLSVGNGFLEVVRDGQGRPAELYHAPARTMRRGRDRSQYFQVEGGQVKAGPFDRFGLPKERRTKGRNEIVHLMCYDPCASYYGSPEWLSALASMALDRVVVEYNTRLFQNSLTATWALIVRGGSLSEEGRKAVRTFLYERATGAENAGRLLLLEEDDEGLTLDFERLDIEMEDRMLQKARHDLRDEVLSAHGVLPRLLGIIHAGHLGGVGEAEAQMRQFVETTMRPLRKEIEGVLSLVVREAEPDAEGLRVVFNEIDVTDLRYDTDWWGTLLGRGVYTPPEVRAMLDRELRQGGVAAG